MRQRWRGRLPCRSDPRCAFRSARARLSSLLGLWLAATRHDQSATKGASANGGRADSRTVGRRAAVQDSRQAAGDDVLAFGIAEAVLHQLANLQGLVVIARTSSFALGAEPGDARAIGRKLNVRYMLEGSVQQEGELLRVTAQLIDTATGAHVWSIRLDKPVSDIFAVQDEIAAHVASALELSVQPDAAARIAGQGTTHLDAYLAYLQGRSSLATGRIGDALQAVEQFQQSLRLDPAFAAAYVSLAEAEVFAAEYGAAEGRAERFERASQRGHGSIEKALALEPKSEQRTGCVVTSSRSTTSAKPRRVTGAGCSCGPTTPAVARARAAVLFERPGEARRSAADARSRAPHRSARARPRRHEVGVPAVRPRRRRGADSLLRNVLQRKPRTCPRSGASANWRGVARAMPRRDRPTGTCGSDRPEAPGRAGRWYARTWTRATCAPPPPSAMNPGTHGAVLRIPVLAYHGDWLRAGETAYAALEDGLVASIDELAAVVAIRRHARLTGQYARAIVTLEALSGVTWQADGSPRLRAPGYGWQLSASRTCCRRRAAGARPGPARRADRADGRGTAPARTQRNLVLARNQRRAGAARRPGARTGVAASRGRGQRSGTTSRSCSAVTRRSTACVRIRL